MTGRGLGPGSAKVPPPPAGCKAGFCRQAALQVHSPPPRLPEATSGPAARLPTATARPARPTCPATAGRGAETLHQGCHDNSVPPCLHTRGRSARAPQEAVASCTSVRHTLSVRQGGRKAAKCELVGRGGVSGIGVFAGGAGAAPCRMFSAPGRPPGDRSCHALPPRCPPRPGRVEGTAWRGRRWTDGAARGAGSRML